ncbi:otolin-1-A-like [Mercenaria mercenaria]|uniref:otolin-1-A-like n=1 Tax=Mercenaria mercenaria TaxID=6596 RepID=UPI00234F7C06|nr:otolin-1-A-like [Mercenaria mercenaria]
MYKMNTCIISSLIVLASFGCTTSFAEETCNGVNELKQIMERKLEEIQTVCDNRYRELEQKLEAKVSKRSVAGGVAFSAQLTAKQSHISLGTTIKFDKLHVNDGSGYNSQTGIFTAPETGVYMFSYFLGHGNGPAQAWLALMHNGQKINGAVTDTFHVNEDLQGGNLAVFRVDAGDRVWIESWHQNDAYIDGPYGFTTFSGVYLYG